nr:hypothetical protein [Tanacetum cinerariifolium]
TDEGTGSKPGVPDVPSDDSEEEISWNSSDDEDVDAQDKDRDDDEGKKNDESDDRKDNDDEEVIAKINEPKDTESGRDDEETESDAESEEEETREKEEESFDPIPRTPKDDEDDGNGEEDQGLRISEEERIHEEEEAYELYRMESIFTTASSSVAPLPSPTSTMTPSTITTTTIASQPPITPTPIPSEVLQNLPTFESVFRFEDRVKSLEVNFLEFMRTNQFTEAVFNFSGTVHQYMHQEMTEAIREAVQIQTDRLQDSLQRENYEFLRTINDNMKKIIKKQVKSQVKEQVIRILPRIEESVNAQLEAEVLTRSSHSSRTSYVVAADLSEMELKKILIDKMEGNKSIQRSYEQRNLYKALVDAYEADKTILDSYGETTILKRRREDDDDQEGPSAGSDRGRIEGGESESASTPIEPATRSASRSTTGTQSRQMSVSESAFVEEPVQTTCQMDKPSHPVFDTGAYNSLTELEYHLEEVYKATSNQLDWVNPEGQQYPHNLLQPLPLIPDNRGRRVIPFAHFINNDLEYLRGGASSRKYTTSMTKTKAADYGHVKWIENLVPRTMWIQEPLYYDKHSLWGVSHWGHKRQQFYEFAINRESALDVYSKRRIISVTNLKIVKWHNYKHLDWISVRCDDDKIYKFKEGDFKGLRLQDIEDMLLLLVQGKLSNLTVEERFAFNVSLRIFTRSIVIQRHVADLQLGVKSYQKRLNLTKPNTDGTLNDVRNALDDCLKGIRMQYLPQTIWRKGNKDRAAAMIQAIDKMLKTRRIMRSLEQFVGGRLYEGDFRMLQRTI